MPVAIALLILLAGGGFSARGAEPSDQLIADIDRLNAAVEHYVNSGGRLASGDDAGQVVSRLREAGEKVFARGGRHAEALRLEPAFRSEPPASARWAFWDNRQRRFSTWRGPAPGHLKIIAHFDRPRTGNDAGPSATPGVGTGRERLIATAWAQGSSTAAAAGELRAPIIDPPGGLYNVSDFYIPVRLRNPNGEALGRIRFNLGGSGWRLYRGETIHVRPGSEIIAFCEPVDSLAWSESGPALAQYRIEPIRLEVKVDTPRPSLPAAVIADPATPDGQLPSIALAVPESVPPAYRSGQFIEFMWTADGSDPRSSPTAMQVGVDSTGRAVGPLQLSSDMLGEADLIVIRAAARSRHRGVLLDSEPVSKMLYIRR